MRGIAGKRVDLLHAGACHRVAHLAHGERQALERRFDRRIDLAVPQPGGAARCGAGTMSDMPDIIRSGNRLTLVPRCAGARLTIGPACAVISSAPSASAATGPSPLSSNSLPDSIGYQLAIRSTTASTALTSQPSNGARFSPLAPGRVLGSSGDSAEIAAVRKRGFPSPCTEAEDRIGPGAGCASTRRFAKALRASRASAM